MKNFNNLHNQIAIDNVGVCCAMLHNVMSKADGGYFDNSLPAIPGGVEERRANEIGNMRWIGLEGMWVHDDNNTPCAMQGIAAGLPLVSSCCSHNASRTVCHC